MLFRIDANGREAQQARRLDLSKACGGSGEVWLQECLYANPALLLGGAIDPLFRDLVPLATELPLEGGGAGLAVDIVAASPLAGIALIEVKLGINADARRKIVAQAMEYAGALRRLGYAGLEARLRGMQSSAVGPGRADSIYEAAGTSAGADPVAFSQAAGRNIRLGRLLLLLVVDRVGPELHSLIDDLRDQPGLPFEIGLQEVACYDYPDRPEEIQIVPRILHRFRAEVRTVVQVDELGNVHARPAPPAPEGQRAQSLTEEEFYQEIGQRYPGLPAQLRQLVADFAEIGARAEFENSMALRGETAKGLLVNFGYIDRNSVTYIYPARAALIQAGLEAALKQYLAEVAALIGGDAITNGPPANWCVKKRGKLPRIGELPPHRVAWRDAAARLLKAVPEGEAREADRSGE